MMRMQTEILYSAKNSMRGKLGLIRSHESWKLRKTRKRSMKLKERPRTERARARRYWCVFPLKDLARKTGEPRPLQLHLMLNMKKGGKVKIKMLPITLTVNRYREIDLYSSISLYIVYLSIYVYAGARACLRGEGKNDRPIKRVRLHLPIKGDSPKSWPPHLMPGRLGAWWAPSRILIVTETECRTYDCRRKPMPSRLRALNRTRTKGLIALTCSRGSHGKVFAYVCFWLRSVLFCGRDVGSELLRSAAAVLYPGC